MLGSRAGMGQTFRNVYIYYATFGWNSQVELYLDVAEVSSVYYGTYYQSNYVMTLGNYPIAHGQERAVLLRRRLR